MKRLIFFLFLLCSVFGWANTEFVVHRYDGTQKVYSVSDRGGLYFEEGNLLISEVYGSQEVEPIANIRKITVQNYPVGNGNVISYESVVVYPNPTYGEINILGVDSETPISLYSLDGQCVVYNQNISTINAQMSVLRSGVYLLLVNGQIIKICKL